MAEKQIKQLLSDMKKRQELRNDEVEEINAEIKRLDLRQETETERFMTGIQEDRQSGVYNNITDGKMQQLIDEQIIQIEERYNTQREELKQKLEEIKKKHIEEKANEYKQISSQIKDFHLDVVLEANKAQKELRQMELERDEKIQEIDNKIKEKEAEQTHLIMQNRNFMNIETNGVLRDIDALGEEIESLKEEKDTITNEYKTKIHEQNEVVKQYLEQKEKVGAFLGKIRLSEKSIDEIYDILFDREAIVTSDEQEVPEEPTVEETPAVEAQESVVETSEVEPKLETSEPKKTVEEVTTTNDINEEELKKIIDEHQEELESEQSAEEVSLEKEHIVGKTGTKEPVVEELPRPIVTVNIPEQEETAKPIKSFEIKISKNGVKLKVIREGEKIGTVRYDDLDTLMDEWEIETFEDFKWANRRIISTIGDTLVVNEIATAVATGMLSSEEGQEQLNNYLALLNGEKEKEGVPLLLEYNLKGMKKSETYSKKGQERIIKEAKEARDLKIAKVKPGFWIGAKWAIQDVASKFGIKLWNKNKGITDGTEYRTNEKQDELENIFEELENKQPSQESVLYDRLGNRTTKTAQEKAIDEKLFSHLEFGEYYDQTLAQGEKDEGQK